MPIFQRRFGCLILGRFVSRQRLLGLLVLVQRRGLLVVLLEVEACAEVDKQAQEEHGRTALRFQGREACEAPGGECIENSTRPDLFLPVMAGFLLERLLTSSRCSIGRATRAASSVLCRHPSITSRHYPLASHAMNITSEHVERVLTCGKELNAAAARKGPRCSPLRM